MEKLREELKKKNKQLDNDILDINENNDEIDIKQKQKENKKKVKDIIINFIEVLLISLVIKMLLIYLSRVNIK